jgi:hypothetical protein
VGAFVGYVPMLLHILFRAPLWPFSHHLCLHLGTWSAIKGDFTVFFTEIVPRVFDLGADNLLHSALTLIWIGGAIALFAVALRRNRAAVPAVDGMWVIGSLAIALAMILAPTLSLSTECRRYCLHMLLGMAWLFARYAGAPGWRRVSASLLAGGGCPRACWLAASSYWLSRNGGTGSMTRKWRTGKSASWRRSSFPI